jgi:hypothetical protein
MTSDSDRELDARLAAAAGFHDEDLPDLPDSFLSELRGDTAVRVDVGSTASEPASVVAARQLVSDARQFRTHPGRRRSAGKRRAHRSVTLLAIAAVGVTTLIITTSDGSSPDPDVTAEPTQTSPSETAPATPNGPPADLGPLEAPPGGLALAATSNVSFPYSLEPEPAGLTPVLSYLGPLTLFGYSNPAVWTARYEAANDPGFTFRVSPSDPRILPPGAEENLNAQTTESTVQVGGVQGDLILGDYDTPSCGYAPSAPEQTDTPKELCADSFAQLTWQRQDGMWLQVWGEDDWSTATAVVSVAESIVDRPQPVPLQIYLAPAGWSVSSYEDNTSLTLTSDSGPSIDNRISVSVQDRWRGYTAPNVGGAAQGNAVEQVTVNGQPAELTSVLTGSSESPADARMWILEYALPNGLIVYFTAPDIVTHDQVLQIAAQVTYTP